MESVERPRYKVLWRKKRKRFVCRWWDTREETWKDQTLDVSRRRDADIAAKAHLDTLVAGQLKFDPLTWMGFRDKYESEKGPTLESLSVWKSAANKLDELVDPEWLADITPAILSTFESKMRSGGLRPASIETYLKYVRAALNWAEAIELIDRAPRVRIPKFHGERRSRGRAVTGEEVDRWLAKIRLDVGEDRYPSWERLITGLNLSGLRLSESLDVWWDRSDMITVLNLDGRRPVWHFPAGYHKARRETTCPMTPDFVAFLRRTPKRDREGPLFSPLGKTRVSRSADYIGRTISAAGRSAQIVVTRQGDEITYATAHDLRRTFGDRWAVRVMPVVLKELMRHKSIETTMQYYVGRSAEQTADIVWQASELHETRAPSAIRKRRDTRG
jgi:integrase